VVEIDPNTDRIVWEYKADPPYTFYTSLCAGSERVANGNTVICDAMNGRIFEVTLEGELVWEYISPFIGRRMITKEFQSISVQIHRAHRYPCDFPGFKGKSLDPRRFQWENRMFGPDAFRRDFRPFIT